jgi:hypothetical protein
MADDNQHRDEKTSANDGRISGGDENWNGDDHLGNSSLEPPLRNPHESRGDYFMRLIAWRGEQQNVTMPQPRNGETIQEYAQRIQAHSSFLHEKEQEAWSKVVTDVEEEKKTFGRRFKCKNVA